MRPLIERGGDGEAIRERALAILREETRIPPASGSPAGTAS
jgi:hypothetical protein